jgi:hypothetical protein
MALKNGDIGRKIQIEGFGLAVDFRGGSLMTKSPLMAENGRKRRSHLFGTSGNRLYVTTNESGCPGDLRCRYNFELSLSGNVFFPVAMVCNSLDEK